MEGAKGEVRACDSSEATRAKCALPREPGRERRWGTFGFNGDDTKALLCRPPLVCEKERVGGLFEGDSGASSGESALEVVGVRGCWSSGLLEPLEERSSLPSAVVGHGADIVDEARDDEQARNDDEQREGGKRAWLQDGRG